MTQLPDALIKIAVAGAHGRMGQAPEAADLLAGSPLLGWMERMAERPSVQNTTWDRLAEAVAA